MPWCPSKCAGKEEREEVLHSRDDRGSRRSSLSPVEPKTTRFEAAAYRQYLSGQNHRVSDHLLAWFNRLRGLHTFVLFIEPTPSDLPTPFLQPH